MAPAYLSISFCLPTDNSRCSVAGAGVTMDHHFQAALDPRKQELLEARFLGARVSIQCLLQCLDVAYMSVCIYTTPAILCMFRPLSRARRGAEHEQFVAKIKYSNYILIKIHFNFVIQL